MTWLAPIPALRDERHFGDRVVRCFVERPDGVPQMLADAVQRNGRGEAVVHGDQRLDYQALDALAGRLAGGLADLGIRRGDRVALLLANGIAFVAAFHAIVRLGAIAVPLNIREERPELAYILANCGATVVIHDTAFSGKVPVTADVPTLLHRVAVGHDVDGGSGVDGAFGFATLAAAPPRAAVAIAEEEVAAILYTSGTTGRPKGAMITHLGLVHSAMIYETCMGLTPADRSVVTVPLSHVTGLTASLVAMLRAAGTLIIAPPFKADTFLELVAAERMTHTVMVPAMYNLCLMHPAMASADLSAWRVGGYGGAPMPEISIARLAGRLPNLQLMNAYGSTETTGPVILMPPAESAGHRAAVGRAVPVTDVRVMDDAGREVASGETGEIWLRAPNVVAGYWHNPEATAAGFVAGYWRSGDLGMQDRDGFVTLLDRLKDMINRGGFKIYSVEVENVLSAHPAVVEAAVVGRPCPVLGERVHVAVVVRAPLALDELRAHCAGRLADYKIPESLTVIEGALPRNANGKVLKRQLRDGLL